MQCARISLCGAHPCSKQSSICRDAVPTRTLQDVVLVCSECTEPAAPFCNVPDHHLPIGTKIESNVVCSSRHRIHSAKTDGSAADCYRRLAACLGFFLSPDPPAFAWALSATALCTANSICSLYVS